MAVEESDGCEEQAAAFVDSQLRRTRQYLVRNRAPKQKFSSKDSSAGEHKRARGSDARSAASEPGRKRAKLNTNNQGSAGIARQNEAMPLHTVNLELVTELPLAQSGITHSSNTVESLEKHGTGAATKFANAISRTRATSIGKQQATENVLNKWHRGPLRTVTASLKARLAKLRRRDSGRQDSVDSRGPMPEAKMSPLVHSLSSLSLREVKQLREAQSQK